MKKYLVSFLTAVRFLTIVPLPWYCENDSQHSKSSVHFFVIVGLLIGVITTLICRFFSIFSPHLVLSAIALLLLALISGFLHLDGLADTADGFFSARPKEKILEIMHDSRTGAMGVLLLFFILLLKFGALASLSGDDFFTTLFFMPLSGRLAIVLTMTFMPYARVQGGLGKVFSSERDTRIPLLGLFIFFVSGLFYSSVLTIITFCTVVITVALFGFWCKRIIGGMTGDTLGAVCEITETSVAIVLSCFLAS